MVNIDPENEEHIRLMSGIFHLPLSTMKKNLEITRSVINAYEKAQELADKE